MSRLLTGALILALALLALYFALRPQGHVLLVQAQYHGPPMSLQHIAPCITPPPGPPQTPIRRT